MVKKMIEKYGKKKVIGCAVVVGTTILGIAVALMFGVPQKLSDKGIEVTQEEMKQYRQMVGDGMDEKRAVFIIFNTQEECTAFISKHGNDQYPENAGLGVCPTLQDGYYNICGKVALENIYDTLKDGEFSREPVEFAGKYCYLKRIETYSPLEDEDKLKELIRNDKEEMLRREDE